MFFGRLMGTASCFGILESFAEIGRRVRGALRTIRVGQLLYWAPHHGEKTSNESGNRPLSIALFLPLLVRDLAIFEHAPLDRLVAGVVKAFFVLLS